MDDYVHWLDLDTGEVEFRPAESPWTPDPSNWRLTFRTPSVFHKSSGDGAAAVDLIDICSGTFQIISRMLSPLESQEHIIITRTGHALEAHLCRLRLTFFVNQDAELECRNMPGYVIDQLQSCGTMSGLRNQLVLRHGRNFSEMPRRVIIPQGDIEFGLDGDYASVSVKTGEAQHVRWHEYTIDTDLGRLTGNVSFHSKLYQCYLHALTSHCLPDPLLGHTGTEESLQMLQSATFLSFQRLNNDDAKLLNLIGNLTPSRAYYPPYMKSMVTVKWNDLPALSQHHDFYPAVLSIFDHACAIEALYHDDDPRDPFIFKVLARDAPLLERTASRNKVYYPSDLQTLRHSTSSTPKDVAYKSRDDGRSAELTAYQTSWSVLNGIPCLSRSCHSNLWDRMQSWQTLGVAETEISLRYSQRWLTFNAAKNWLGIYDICQEALNHDPEHSKIRLAFSLSAASISGTNYADIIPLILIFATDSRFRDLVRPSPSQYDLSDGTYPEYAPLVKVISRFALPLEETPAQTMVVRAISPKKVAKERRQEYNRSISEKTSTAAQSVLSRWPGSPWKKGRCRNVPREWFDTERCKTGIDAYLQSVSRNITLKSHIHRLQIILNSYEITTPLNTPYVFSPSFSAGSQRASPTLLRGALMSRASSSSAQSHIHEQLYLTIPTKMATGAESSPLAPPSRGNSFCSLIHEFRQSRESLLQFYGEELSKSRRDLVKKVPSLLVHRGIPAREALFHYRDMCSERKSALFSELSEALAPSQKHEVVLSFSGLWPRITPRSILQELSRDRIHLLTDQSKHTIIRYAVAFLKYQQSQRLLELSSRCRDEELLREAETTCEEVASDCSPDWLLIQVSYYFTYETSDVDGRRHQIDANFLARPLQLAVAREMISPTCQRSASFQLNMGEGKSSVIVPLVAATLADGTKLARIVTLKPLANQMYQLLLSRISNLADRRIFYVPFSRDPPMSASAVQSISALYKRCVDEGGVLVVQPEHLLSQKLMSIDTLITSQDDPQILPTATQLQDLQRWLARVSRDVLDESDEILHVRYQLVYTSGGQMPPEDFPNRWSTTQQVFSRLRAHAARLHDSFPKKFELDQTRKGFPKIRILDREVSRFVSLLVVDDALGGAFSTLQLAVLSPSIREATRRFIIQKKVSNEDHQLVRSHCSGTTLWNGILLLRGLLVDGEGILGYVLKERRWRVDYGLHPSRTLLAVPYRAKVSSLSSLPLNTAEDKTGRAKPESRVWSP